MKYSNIISDMTWSYSRIRTFEDCPYQFFLTYIKKQEKDSQFFAEYGSFMHKIIEKYLKKELKKNELKGYFLQHFKEEVKGIAPSRAIFKSYFTQGLQYLDNMSFPYVNLLGIEKKVDFFIGDKKFTAVIDCIVKDDGAVVVVDNKSRALKPRSTRTTPTKADRELDEYLMQLYLYSIPIKQLFGKYPERLEFNCFRTGEWISEPFKEEVLEHTKKWALETIDKIIENDDWSPDMEYWKCRYLCGVHKECEYWNMNRS